MAQTIYYTASALCGAGKTYQAIRWASSRIDNIGLKLIYAVPTCKLSEQVTRDFKEEVNPSKVTEINSETHKKGSVEHLKSFLSDFSKTNEGGVVVITHRSLELLANSLSSEVKGCYELIVDETPSVVKPISLKDSTGHLDLYTRLFDMSDKTNIVPHADYFDTVQKIADGKHEDTKYTQESIRAVCSAAISPTVELQSITDHEGKKQCIHFIATTSYRLVEGYSRVVLMSALIETSMLFKVWEAQGVDFRKFLPITTKLGNQQKHTRINGRVKVFYLTECRWTSGTHTRDFNYMSRVLKALPSFFNGKEYLLSVNEHTKLTSPNNAKRVSIKSLGQNDYKEYHNIAYLAATNGIPQVIATLKAEFGFDDNDILDLFVLPDAYQTVLRTSLRDPSVKADRHILVGSKELAVKLAGLIESAVVLQLKDFEKTDGRHKTNPMSQSDRKKKSRLEEVFRSGKKLKPSQFKTLEYLVATYPQCEVLMDKYHESVSPFEKAA